MIRKIEERDREDFLRLSAEFYASPAVLHDIPASRHEAVFDEFMRGSAYTDGVILEADGKTVGFGITAKTYSREAGGRVLTVFTPAASRAWIRCWLCGLDIQSRMDRAVTSPMSGTAVSSSSVAA